MVVMDYFSKWKVVDVSKEDAKTITEILLQNVISKYGVLLEIYSDLMKIRFDKMSMPITF